MLWHNFSLYSKKMRLKRKLVWLVVLLLLTVLVMYGLPYWGSLIPAYDRFVFYPFQSARGAVFGAVPFSCGDVFYVAGGLWLAITVGKWVHYLFQFKTRKAQLAVSALNTINAALGVYLFFVIGWGANYYKPSLGSYWQLYPKTDSAHTLPDSTAKRLRKEKLVAYEQYLLEHVNAYAPGYRSLSVKEINNRACNYYCQCTDSKVSLHGLQVKPSLYGYFMEYAAVGGYYNPFTGEGQVDAGIPAFIMPFTLTHEMAHQAGIAAEDDANLLAYALGTATPDSTFRYSAYLDLWLYNNGRLYRRDSALAKQFEARLNPLTKAHIDTLEEIDRKYHNEMAQYSSKLYDSYLKMQDQKDGIRSYGNVAGSAWLLEQKRMRGMDSVIRIP